MNLAKVEHTMCLKPFKNFLTKWRVHPDWYEHTVNTNHGTWWWQKWKTTSFLHSARESEYHNVHFFSRNSFNICILWILGFVNRIPHTLEEKGHQYTKKSTWRTIADIIRFSAKLASRSAKTLLKEKENGIIPHICVSGLINNLRPTFYYSRTDALNEQ